MKPLEILNKSQSFAIIGMSDNQERYSNKIYYKLKEKNKTVYGINPKGQYYHNLKEIQGSIDVAVLIVNPSIGIKYLNEISNLNIKYLWIQPGAESEDIITQAHQLDLNVIQSCILREYKATEIKAVVSDLDETLLGHSKIVSPKNLAAIQKLRDKGIKFIPATGRPFYSIQNTLKELNLFDDDDYSITFNGGMIHHNASQKNIRTHSLDHNTANWLYQFGKDKDVCIHIYLENETYTYNLNEDEKHHLKNFPSIKEVNWENLDHIEEPIIKLLYQNTNIPYLKSIEKEIPNHIKEQLEISYSSNRYLEFNPKNVNKGMAVKELAQILNIPTHQILTIGDNSNDLSMLKVTEVSSAPKNAIKEVKEHVTYTSSKNFEEDSVHDILTYFKII